MSIIKCYSSWVWFALCLVTTSAEQLCVNVSQCGVIANCRLETYHILLWKFGIFWKYASVYFPGIINEKWILLWYCWEYDPFLNYFLCIKLDANCLMRSLSDRSISKSIARVKCQTLLLNLIFCGKPPVEDSWASIEIGFTPTPF